MGRPSARPITKWVPLALAFVLIAYAGWAVRATQWDFEVYYYAAKAFLRGLDPYQTASLVAVAGKPMRLPFVYPPVVLLLVAPLTKLDIATAKTVFLLGKLLSLLGVLAIWGSLSKSAKETALIAVLVVMGFSTTVFADLYAGNITCFEQLLFWTGVLALLSRRLWLCAVLLALSATVKLEPIALLLILLVEGRPAIGPVLAGIGSFVAIEAASWLAFPRLTGHFVRAARHLHEVGRSAPSLEAFLDEALHTGAKAYHWTLHSWVVPDVHVVCCLLVLALFVANSSRVGLRFLRTSGFWYFLSGAILTYLLILPRLKSYGFSIAIPVAAWLLLRARRGLAALGVLALCVSTSAALPKAIFPKFPYWHFVLEYYPLLCVFVLWCSWLAWPGHPFRARLAAVTPEGG